MSTPPKQTAKELSIERYAGVWYEIARFPHFFEKNLQYVTATYTLKKNGKISVTNRGKTPEGKWKEANGRAWMPDAAEPGKLRVQFFWPFSAPYWVHRLDPEYKYVLVGGPGNDYLWILSREKTMPDAVYNDYVETAKTLGYPVVKLQRVQQ